MFYDIKPFKDATLCYVYALEVCDVLLGKPYMLKHHYVYMSRPLNVSVILKVKPYRIP